MQPAKLSDELIYRGDDETFSLLFIIGGTDPYPLDVWAEIRCQIRKEAKYTSEEVMTLTTKDGTLEISGDDKNRLIFNLNSAKTDLFKEQTVYYADIKFINAAGNAQTMLTKKFNVTLNITED